ncbi:DUF2982 domain-containing protein [Shewanella colwelliana]|uniref:DUF2982 domain-containing protein n=1 Tax=Shewanella colwelliana TaxID=23 RepID=UPI0037352F1E
MSVEPIIFRPTTKHNGWTFTLVGAVMLICGLLFFVLSKTMFGPGMVCFLFGMVLTVLGVAKLIQPEVSVEFRSQGLVYHHRRGTIYLRWENIQRVDVPRSILALDSDELPYIGLRLNQLSALLDDIPPRLATGLLTEQRPLLMSSLTLDGELSGLEHYLNSEFSPLNVDGKPYDGVKGMFARRCEQLNNQLGYHLYLPTDCLDREPRAFLTLLRDYKARAMAEN